MSNKMKIKLILYLMLFPILTFGQDALSKINIDVKPVDSKKGYIFQIYKMPNEVKIYYKTVDSSAKIVYNKKETVILIKMMEMIGKPALDSLTNDSLTYFQRKIDSIKTANTFYKVDSATIYKSSHPAYWKFLEAVLATPNDVLTAKKETIESADQTYCFFTFIQNNEERQVFIESLNAKIFPILTKLINDTMAIMKAHKLVMERKN